MGDNGFQLYVRSVFLIMNYGMNENGIEYDIVRSSANVIVAKRHYLLAHNAIYKEWMTSDALDMC